MHPKTSDGIARSTDAFLASLTGGATAALPLALTGPDLPVKGLGLAEMAGSGGSGLPKRSKFGISHLPNGGVVIVNPLDEQDNYLEARICAK